MRLSDLSDELMVDLDELEEKMDNYLENVTKEELIRDLERVGCTVEKIKQDEIEGVFSGLNVSLSSKGEGYIVTKANNKYDSNDDTWELAA